MLGREIAFYVSTVYGYVSHLLSLRTWYSRINANILLGALPLRSSWPKIESKENVTHMVSMLEPFEVKSFVLGPKEARDRGLLHLSLPVRDFVGIPNWEQATKTPVDLAERKVDSCEEADEGVIGYVRRRSASNDQVDVDSQSAPTSEGDRCEGDQIKLSSEKAPWKESKLSPTHRASFDQTGRFSCCVAAALLLRLVLLAFSVWQDETRWPDGQLRFTDVDYDVFSDAARALIRGEDIYEARPTYRYSPLIAAIVAPGFLLSSPHNVEHVNSPSEFFFYPPLTSSNVSAMNRGSDPLFARIWGKLVFILADIVCAWLQFQIIRVEALSRARSQSKDQHFGAAPLTTVSLICFGWLFNPVTAVVSVRGNAEAVLGVCVLACLLLVIHKCAITAGLLFGLCVHLKLYPVIYAPAIYLWFAPVVTNYRSLPWKRRLWLLLPRWSHIRFSVGALTSLSVLTGLGYCYFGGWRFLHQAYLYHFSRVDIKHNFAPHFYPLYLLSGLEWRQSGLVEAGTFVNASPAGRARDLLDRLQSTVAGLVYSSDKTAKLGTSLTVLFRSAVQSLLQDESRLQILKLVFSLVSVLPAVFLIPFLAFRLRRTPGLCWFATTYAFVTFNKVSL
ncbi:unnamed protein product [Echinostoma caproni]|uniref:GPI alpha-1,4-mannosyltransferase I, catalytic subunit n=1 Tax=Echinostoma caproni TaxID=27848 RepID=A0A183AEQ3_9TREM|nr:unnamed protein product [Echinostoma caproni]